MIYVGVDQSYTDTGICAIKDDEPFLFYNIKGGNLREGNRLSYFFNCINNFLELLREKDCYTIMGLEDYAYGAKFRVASSGELGGLFKLAAYEKRVPLFVYPIKSHRVKTLGKGKFGRNSKEIKQLVLQKINDKFGLDLDNHNLADAVSIAWALKKDWEEYRKDDKLFEFFIQKLSEEEKELCVNMREKNG